MNFKRPSVYFVEVSTIAVWDLTYTRFRVAVLLFRCFCLSRVTVIAIVKRHARINRPPKNFVFPNIIYVNFKTVCFRLFYFLPLLRSSLVIRHSSWRWNSIRKSMRLLSCCFVGYSSIFRVVLCGIYPL